MTEEQLEALRRQISVYATICQQLVEMHKASLSKEISAPGQYHLNKGPPFFTCTSCDWNCRDFCAIFFQDRTFVRTGVQCKQLGFMVGFSLFLRSTLMAELVRRYYTVNGTGIMATGVQPSSVMDQVTMTPMHRATVRQRWTPSQNQLQILEGLFEQGNGTPSKQRIKEITTELMQHGHVGETNVYNWFQNRKARAKRKQQVLQGIHHPPSLRKFLQLPSIWVEVEIFFVSVNKVQLSFHHICREVLRTL